MDFIIDRQVWLRGNIPSKPQPSNSVLYRQVEEDKFKACCVGIFLMAAGVPISDLTEVGEAVEVRGIENYPEASFLFREKARIEDEHEDDIEIELLENTIEANELYQTNDWPEDRISELEREDRITKLFAAAGHRVIFIN